MSQTAMSPVNKRKNNEQSRRWSKERDSAVTDTKLDFCGEWTKWSYRTNSTLQWSSSSPLNDAYKKKCRRSATKKNIDTDVNAEYVRKVVHIELNETRYNLKWYLPHHPVINPHNNEKVRRMCNAASKYQDVDFNKNFISGRDLLQSLIGIGFREQEKRLSADIEAMFLQFCVQWRHPMSTIPLARRARAKNGS